MRENPLKPPLIVIELVLCLNLPIDAFLNPHSLNLLDLVFLLSHLILRYIHLPTFDDDIFLSPSQIL